MTVSRVVNGQPLVVERTRDKVNVAIEALGCVPNSAARSLAAGGKRRIALLHCNPSAAYLSEFLMGAFANLCRKAHLGPHQSKKASGNWVVDFISDSATMELMS